MRARWSERPNCSHNMPQKVKRIRRLSEHVVGLFAVVVNVRALGFLEACIRLSFCCFPSRKGLRLLPVNQVFPSLPCVKTLVATIHFPLFMGEWFTNFLFIHGFFSRSKNWVLFRPTFRVKSWERLYSVLVNFNRCFPRFQSILVNFYRFFLVFSQF